MPLELVERKAAGSRPVHLIVKGRMADAGLTPHAVAWAEANKFTGESGRLLPIPGEAGAIAGALFGLGDGSDGALGAGALARALPDGDWQSYGKGQFFIVPKGVKFEVEAVGDVAYLCYYKR